MNKFDNEKIYYDYGQIIDLDGITPQEIVENIQNAGSQKTKITINGIVSKGNDDEFNIIFTPTSTLQDVVKLSITINGVTDVVEMSSKDSELVYGPVDKYCSAIIDVSPYSSKTAKYYTTFKNENGNGLFNVTLIATKNNQETIIETKQYKYNTNVEIETPIFEGYSFNKWEIIPNSVNIVESNEESIKFIIGEEDITLKCHYDVAMYTVTWKNENGNVLETDENVPYGTTPEYNGETPTKQGNAQYTYAFNGWDKEIESLTEDVVYTATYSQTVNEYTITWKNENGNVLETDENVPYGTTPEYNGETPTKQGDAQYTYTFSGWDKEIANVTGDVVYTATYSQTMNEYTVIWKDENGEVLETDLNVPYGTTPEYNGETPTKQGDAQYAYTFSGWDKEIANVTGDVVYTATYSQTVNEYTVTWKNENGEVLETDENVPYGTTPEYNGETPTKQEDTQYTYTFNGWDKEIESVTEDVVYTATYNEVIKQYTLNIDITNGSSNITSGTKFDYGTNVEIILTANEGYSVNGEYDRETVVIKNVTIEEDTTINHEFMINMYDITFVDHDDNSIETLSVNYNEKLVVPSDIEPSDYEDDQYVWKFNGNWNPEINENTKVLRDQIYKAQYSPELRTFELGIKVENGTYNISSRDGNETYTYGEVVEITIIPNEGYSIDGKPTETYEVVITEDTELTYVCDLITYSLTVNEDFKGNFAPNDDISSYLTYTEEENKIHTWMEGDVEFIDTIMPDRDLVLTSKYTEKPVEDIMIYYGSKLINELDTFNNENITNNLNSFTYDETITEYGNLTPPFKQPTLNNDAVWEEFYAKSDSSIWEENGFVNCILAPSNLTVNLSVDGTNLNTINQYNTYTINGIEYNLYIGQPSQPYDSWFNGSGVEYTNAIIIITQ
jgi:hypothetical protein